MDSTSSEVKRRKNENSLKREKVFVRMSPTDYAIILANALLYTGGNMSEWLRRRASEPMLEVSIEMLEAKNSGGSK